MVGRDALGVTRDGYDAAASVYAEMFREAHREKPLDRAVLQVFAEYVGGGGVVADLGCGPGHVTAYLAESGLDVFGIDASPAMIALAREAYPRLRFEIGDMARLEIPDATLAGILSRWSVIHTPPAELPPVLAEFARILASGGHLLLGFSATDDGCDPPQVFDHAVAPAYRWSPDHLAGLLGDHGLAEVARTIRAPQPTDQRPFPAVHLLVRKV
ncbi:class I SAM-dependent methyltransferase [Streptomyces sp. NPDC060194]|uniref:class I SAM-dependent methyltransferase n=1 Tax=Streptomyces sp. NPDC060194 TaxID=3347069 RepID=UPI00364914D7